MRLNQVTLPSKDLDQSISFYENLGFLLIVKNDHYARLENPEDETTLSLELREDCGDGAHLYFECDDLDDLVTELKRKGLVFDNGPQDQPWKWLEAWLRDPVGNKLCPYLAGENRRFPPWRMAKDRFL
jgi:catechol 2,3-dioxygenase-like lactoylglutathione lyase family enzyme